MAELVERIGKLTTTVKASQVQTLVEVEIADFKVGLGWITAD